MSHARLTHGIRLATSMIVPLFGALACGGAALVGCASDEPMEPTASDAEAWKRRGHRDAGSAGDAGGSDASAPGTTMPTSPEAESSDGAAPAPADGGGTLSPTDCTVIRCHYVRSGATGSRDGSDWTNAYASLPTTLVRGDTYFIADGAYAGYTFGTAPSGTTPITVKKAIASDHGTGTGWVDAYGDATSPGVRSGALAAVTPWPGQ